MQSNNMEEILKAILEQSLAGYWDWDIPSGNLYLSPVFKKMLGYEDYEIENRVDSIKQLIFVEDLPDLFKIFNPYAKNDGNVPFYLEVRYHHKSGSVKWVICTGKVIEWDKNGNALRMVGCHIDITKQKQSEYALKESEEKLRLFIEHAPAALAMFDSNMRYIAVSRRWISDYNLTQSDLIGKSHYDVFPEISDELKSIHQRGMNGEMVKGDDARFERADGSVQWVCWEMWPWKTAAGLVGGIIIFSEDITKRKQAEEVLSNIQKLESLGVLAGGIAHDFNNLLGGIFGLIDITVQGTTEETTSKYLSMALNTIDRARSLTRQLLTFAKGGTPVKKLSKLSPFIIETANFAVSGSNVSCSYNIPVNLWQCEFDKNQISQVIDNIVINAQQAMPEGGLIKISAENFKLAEKEHLKLPAGNYIKISIEDHGIGMPKQILAKIFDPFFTTKSKGHGLGLATSYSIINRHGGYIEVNSVTGKGSIFTIILPAAPDKTIDADHTFLSTHKGSGSVLLMDDEEVIRDTLSIILKNLGYNVYCVTNAEDAIELFKNKIRDNENLAALVFDMTIPGGRGGKELINEIREIDKNIPVFVISGYTDDPVMADPQHYGFTASIAKPFKVEHIMKIFNKFIVTH